MPNWCKNSMLVTGSKADIDSLISKVKTAEQNFDLNGIIPMPSTLSVEASSTAKSAYAIFYGTPLEQRRNVIVGGGEKEYQEKLNEILNDVVSKGLADTYHHNLQNYGHTTWYDWCSEVWGTKWNTSDAHMGEVIKVAGQELYQVDFFFETAWNFPEGVFNALATQYPQLTFSVDVDEEGGFFWGNILIQNGEVVKVLESGVRSGGPYDYGDDDDEDGE